MWKNYLFINVRINTHKHLENHTHSVKIPWRVFGLFNGLEYLIELRKIAWSIKDKVQNIFLSIKYLAAKSKCNVQWSISDRVNYARILRCVSAHTSKATRLIYFSKQNSLPNKRFWVTLTTSFMLVTFWG